MSNIVPITEFKQMAGALAPLFNKKPEDLFALMLIADAEGKHPAAAALEYDIIQGRPSLNSRAALSRFQASGGSTRWLERTAQRVTLHLTHPKGGELKVTWDMQRAQYAGLATKDLWKKYPTEMLSARCISEGVRALYPACLFGLYTTEEVQDFDAPKGQKQEQQKAEPQNADFEIVSESKGVTREEIVALFNEKAKDDESRAVVLAEIEQGIGKPMAQSSVEDYQKIKDILNTF